MPKFKLDENMPVEAAQLLAAAGHDVATVVDQGMGGQPDATVATACQVERRAIVTFDLDFADIRAYPPADYHGIIVFRLSRPTKHHLLAGPTAASDIRPRAAHKKTLGC
jgi:predicted nuclease of predicted toxin-antitoxin system